MQETTVPTLTNNINDVALVFEGGGMRNAYTAAVVSEFVEQGLFFDHVSGISASGIRAIRMRRIIVYRPIARALLMRLLFRLSPVLMMFFLARR